MWYISGLTFKNYFKKLLTKQFFENKIILNKQSQVNKLKYSEMILVKLPQIFS